jgi:hypothetical protein
LRPGRRGNGVSWVAVLVALLPLTVGSFASAAERKADLVIDDLASFAPASAVSRQYQRGTWWWCENVEGARGGTLLVTGKWRDDRPPPPLEQVEADAPGAADNYVDNLVPPITVAPDVRGWHRIHFVGIYSRPRPSRTHIDLLPFRFGARLGGEPYPVFIQGSDDAPATKRASTRCKSPPSTGAGSASRCPARFG